MAGSLSTLGLGSSGVLTNDLIDKLRDADNTSIIKPIEQQQESLELKQTGLESIKTMVSDLYNMATDLANPDLYKETKIDISGDSLKATSTTTLKAQSIEIDVEQLAERDIKQSEKFTSKDTALGAGSLELNINGHDYSVEITDTDTLETLSQKIKEETDGEIEGSVLNIGGDEPYRLILKATNTGEKNEISTAGSSIRFYQTASHAQDAELIIDGVSVTRSSNKIDDLVNGLTIELEKEGTSTIKLSQDTENTVNKVDEFVTQYNEILSTISTLTKYDSEKKVGAVFQGTSEIRDIKTQMKNIFATAISDEGKSIEDYGFTTARSGEITFDKSKFENALKSSPEELEKFFVGPADDKGIFANFESTLFDIGTSSSGPLKSLKTNYDTKSKALEEALHKAQESLDSKYEIMQKKFASYDAVIGQLSNTATYLDSIIEAQYAKN